MRIEEKEQEIEELKETIENNKKMPVNDNPFSGFGKRSPNFEDEGGYIPSKMDRATMGGEAVSDAEKVEKLIERVKDYKNQIDMNNELIKILKEDIKNLKQKLTDFETFGGKITNYNEFIRVFNIALKDYKPKKKEQKEALSQLRNHLKKELD